MRIVGGDLAFCLGNPLLMSAACLGDLFRSLVFAAPMVFFGPAESLPGRIDRSFALLLPAEHTAEPSHRLRLEVSPLRGRKRNCQLAQVQRRHGNTAPERVEADPGIACERRSQQPF